MALSRAVVLAIACIGLTGCQEKETVVDIQTPAGDVEVTKDKADGDVEVTVDRDAPAAAETAPE
jgi:proline racemase